jgi:hypothetical protein
VLSGALFTAFPPVALASRRNVVALGLFFRRSKTVGRHPGGCAKGCTAETRPSGLALPMVALTGVGASVELGCTMLLCHHCVS